MQCQPTFVRWHQARIAVEVNFVPLSETTVAGQPRTELIAAKSRATRAPDGDVSATKASHSRLWS